MKTTNPLNQSVIFDDYRSTQWAKTSDDHYFKSFLLKLLQINHLKLYLRTDDDGYYLQNYDPWWKHSEMLKLKENHDVAYNFKTNFVYQTKTMRPDFNNKEFWTFDNNNKARTFTINRNPKSFAYPETYYHSDQSGEIIMSDGSRILGIVVDQNWVDKDLFYQYLKSEIENHLDWIENDMHYDLISFQTYLKQVKKLQKQTKLAL